MYCQPQKTCVINSTMCANMAESCDGGKKFSLTSGRCTEQNMTCSHNTTLGFGDFDYYKISSYMVYTTSGPKRILIDQSNQRFRLEPGDVFGVRFPHFGPTAALKTSSSGSTLFYSSSMVNDTNSTTLRGNRFPLTAESPSQMSYTPAIAFFYSVDSESKLEHVYQNIGHAKVLTSIGNSTTRVNNTESICLQEDIKGLQSYFPEVFPFGEAVNVTGGISQGSNVTFYWDFGDKNNATSLIPWVTHVFNHTVGLKTVSIIAGNNIRVEAVWCTVLVQERILGLQFKDTTLLSIENGTTAEIAWILLNGSHVDFTLNITYPNGSIVSKNLTNVKAPAATFFGKYNTTLTQPGWYRIEITASNRLDNVTLVRNLSVQRVVHGVTMDSPKILKTNQTFNFTIPPHQGNEVRYLLNTMDGNIINTTERLIPFNYTKAGRYDAYLIAWNDISSVAVKCGQIIVQDVIEGLQFISFNHTVAVHAQAEINWILTQGSELEILVNYGDGSSTFVNRSLSVGDVFVAISKHNYSKPGEYLVTINVTNLVDSEEINTTVYVETPRNGVILAIGRYNLSTAGNDSCKGELYVRVNDSVTATATVENGTNIYGYMDFGGNSSVRVRYFHREFPGEGWTECYSYSLAGEYNITITFSNRNPGDVNQFCRVIVQNPINVVMVTSDSPKKRTERDLTFTVSFPGSLQPSGRLRYLWRYGDGKELVWDKRTKIHSYPNRCGVYIATVNVSNEISFGLGQAEVVVQDEVKDLKWSANYTKLNVDYSGECSSFVRENDTFPFDYAVAFSASANGTNVSYTWSFPRDVNKTNSSCTHKFKKEGKNQIALTAKNAVSSETKIISLKLVEDIWNVSFVNDGPTTQNSQVNFTLSMTRKGEGSFFHIDFKDSSIKEKIFKSPKSTYRHGGDDADEVRVRKHQTFGVTYKNVGKYPVSLHARNNVSCVYQVSEVAVARGLVQERILGLQFKDTTLLSIENGTTAEIAWILLNGSHVDFTLNITYPDGFNVSKNLTNVKAQAATFFGKYNTTLTQPGWYRIEITASNRLDNVTLVGNLSVQRVVHGVTMDSPKILKTNQTFNFTIPPHQGNEVRYLLNTMDGNIINTTERLIPFNYTKAGRYDAYLIAWNDISSVAVKCGQIIVQDEVKDLKCFANYTKILKTNQTFNFKIPPHQGSEVRYSLNTMDGNIINTTERLIPFNYTKAGRYDAYLIAWNDISSVAVKCGQIIVQDEVKDLKCFANYTKILKTNQTFNFKIPPHQGNEVRYSLNTMDGNIINTTERLIPFNYTKAGRYAAYLIAWNDISSVAVKCGQIIVQDEVKDLKCFANYTKILKTNQTFNFKIPPHQGSEVRYSLNTMDGNIINTTERLIPFNYTKAGRYDAYLIAWNDISSVAVKCGQIIVQDEVKDLKCFANYTKILKTNQTFNFKIPPHQGSEVRYSLNTMDGNIINTTERLIPFNYTKAGRYDAYLIAWNDISSVAAKCGQIIVQDEVKDLKCFANYTKILKTNQTFNFKIPPHQGNEVRYSLNTMDGNIINTTERLIPFNYTKAGRYDAYLIAWNDISSVAAKCGQIIVQDEVKDLKCFANYTKILKTNQTFNFKIPPHQGNEVRYSLNTMDGNIINTTERLIPFNYTKAGRYAAYLIAWNDISSVAVKCGQIIVQDEVKDLKCFANYTKILKTNQTFNFKIPPHQGSEVRYSLNTMDGNIINTTERLIPFNYTKAGRYDAYLIAWNDISSVAAKCGQIIVQDEVKDLKCFANYTKILKTNQTFNFKIPPHQGSEVRYSLNTMDGNIINTTERLIPFNYTKAGRYDAYLIAWNDISSVAVKCGQIIVQDEVKDLKCFANYTKILKTNQTFNFKIPPHQGSEVRYSLNTMDGNIINTTERLIPFNYTKAGRYDAYLIAWNDISSVAAKCGQIIVQDEVKDLKCFANYTKILKTNQTFNFKIPPHQGSEVRYSLNTMDGNIINTTERLIPFNYTKAGRYDAYLIAWNDISSVAAKCGQIIVQDEVKDLKCFANYTKILKTNQTFNFKIPPHQGNEVRYSLNTMDGNIINTTERLIPFNYTKAGRYAAYLIAWNDISSVAVKCGQIIVQDEVKDLKCFANYTKILKTNQTFNFKIPPHQGSEVRYSLNTMDGNIINTTERLIPFNYTKAGRYDAYLIAWNDISSVAAKCGQIIVQDEVKDLKCFANYTKILKTNQTFNFKIPPHQGSEVRYSLKTMDGNIINTTERLIPFNYTKAGRYDAYLIAWNDISSVAVKCGQIIVQDEVKDLKCFANYTKILKTNQTFNFKIPPHQGSEVRYSLNTMDGNIINTTERLIPFNYTKAGRYDAYLIAWNDLSSVAAKCGQIIAQDEVKDLKWFANYTKLNVDYSGNCSNFVRQNDTFPFDYAVAFSASANGTNVSYTWSFPEGVNKTNSSCTHKFKEKGEKQIVLTAKNAVSSETKNISLKLVEDIWNVSFVNDGPSAQNSQVNFTLSMTRKGEGSFFHIDFKDSSIKKKIFKSPKSTYHIDGQDAGEVRENQTFGVTYKNVGKYPVSLHARNNVSCVYQVSEVAVQDEVKDLKWFANYTKLNVDYSGNCSNFVRQNDTFPFDYAVAFSASANGTNVSYTWSFPEGVNKTNSSCTHKFKEKGEKQIVLTAKNAVSSETKNISLKLVEDIWNVSFVNDGPSAQNSQVNFTLSMTRKGEGSFFHIDFKDSSIKKKIFKSPKSTYHLDGQDAGEVRENQTFGVTYKNVGKYPVSLHARNNVSCVYQVSEVVVARGFCTYPVISVPGFEEAEPRKFKRSEKISIKTDTKLNCFNYSTTLRWEIDQKCDGQQPIPVTELLKKTEIDVDRSELLIPARFFDYCSEVEARFTVNMTEAPGVSKVKTIKFEITKSPLRPIISGGSERTVGSNHLVEIDAENSHDPDATTDKLVDQDLKFAWFCHRANETYSLPANLTKLPPVPTAEPATNGTENDCKDLGGCFGCGPGRLNFTSRKITLNTSEMIPGDSYVIIFAMDKEGREMQNTTQHIDVKPGDPPILTIK